MAGIKNKTFFTVALLAIALFLLLPYLGLLRFGSSAGDDRATSSSLPNRANYSNTNSDEDSSRRRSAESASAPSRGSTDSDRKFSEIEELLQ